VGGARESDLWDHQTFEQTAGGIAPRARFVIFEKRKRTWRVRELQGMEGDNLLEQARSQERALPEMVSNAINPPGDLP
jgi:hypothetical protein